MRILNRGRGRVATNSRTDLTLQVGSPVRGLKTHRGHSVASDSGETPQGDSLSHAETRPVLPNRVLPGLRNGRLARAQNSPRDENLGGGCYYCHHKWLQQCLANRP